MKLVELGDEVECKITGHRGVVTSTSQNLTGCDRVYVQPPVDKEGKQRDGWWIDNAACKIVKKGKVKPESVREIGDTARAGGPMNRIR